MFQIHVYVRDPASGLSWWRAMHASGDNKPYRFVTREEAQRVMNMAYPLSDSSQVKIVDEDAP